MMKNVVLMPTFAFASVLSLSVLAGCGGTTYGTGVSQETQLASDVGGLLLLGKDDKKKPINYASRTKLVKAPTSGQLPSPTEKITSDSAYFPTNPEEARAKHLASLKDNGERAGSYATGADTRVLESGVGVVDKKMNRNPRYREQEQSAAEMLRTSQQGRQERLARAKEARSLGGGTAPRKYLTQPPAEYRTPAESAPVGVTGEHEKSEAEKRKKSVFGSWGS